MHDIDYLPLILILLAAAIINVAIFRRLSLSPVLGYLAAGAIIGPHGIRIVHDVATTSAIAELGVVLLLFLIGLELSFQRLREMRLHIFGFGTMQVVLSSLIVGFVALLLGASNKAALIIGGGMALSSTALVLQVLAEHRERNTQMGRLSIAVLLLQDLAVVPLLVLVPLLANHSGSIASALLVASMKATLALALIFSVGRLLLRPFFRAVAGLGNGEIFTAFTLLVVLGVSFATYQAGLSLALGAFIAGLLVAETEYKHQVEADVLPYKGLLLGLFFMVVGMSIDIEFILSNFVRILGLACALMSGKALILFLLCRLFRFDLATSLRTGFLLSQGGEFGFVLFGLSAEYQLIDEPLAQLLLVLVTVSMALTPLAYVIGRKLASRLDPTPKSKAMECESETIDLERHVIIAGFGRVGQTVAKLLYAENIHYVALDSDPKIVTEMRKRGLPVYYGDSARREVLTAMGLSRARCMIITVNDFFTAEKTVRAVRAMAPDLNIIVRTSDIQHLKKLEAAGAQVAVSEMFEASLQLGAALLRHLNVPDQEVTRIIDIFRTDDYALTRAGETTLPENSIKTLP